MKKVLRMAGGFLSKIFGGGNVEGKSNTKRDPLFTLLAPYDLWEKGLSKRAVTYIREGDGRPVLAALVTGRTKPRQRQNHDDYRKVQQEMDAQNVYLHNFSDQPEALARFSEVLTAARGTPYRSTYRTILTDDTPDAVLSMFLQISGRGYSNNESKPASPTGFSDVMKATEILGGTPADVISICFSYNMKIGERLLSEHIKSLPAEHFVTALARCKASDRARVMKQLDTYPVAKDPAFLDFLMESACSGSAQVRTAAGKLLALQPADAVQERAIPLLDAGKVVHRSSAVQILGGIGSESALAALKARGEVEKSQDVLAAINHYTGERVAQAEAAPEGQYLAADGSYVDIPDVVPITDDGSAPFDEADLKALKVLDEKRYADDVEYYKRHTARIKAGDKTWGRAPNKPERREEGSKLYALLNAPVDVAKLVKRRTEGNGRRQFGVIHYAYHLHPWLEPAVQKLPKLRLVQLALLMCSDVRETLQSYRNPFSDHISLLIEDGELELRQIMLVALEMGIPLYTKSHPQFETFQATPSAFMRVQFGSSSSYNTFHEYPTSWPLAIAGLNDVLGALPPRITDVWINDRALSMLAAMPKLPMAAVDAVLFAALDERKRISEPAQKMLMDVDGIDDRLIATLTDKRQVVRGKAAKFLADREAKAALPAIVKKLKTEKSESARADMISAVARLGGDTSPYLGRNALMKEAETFVSKLPNAKIDWLQLETAPVMKWNDGKPVDPMVADAWLRLALKLKSPTGSPLFGLYFDQLDPASVTEFCDWVLNSWIAYDIWKPATDELRAKAQKQAEQDKKAGKHWYARWEVDQIANYLLRLWTSGYPNSGTDAKGILALTHRASPVKSATVIASYLKQHGKRVSQAKCLVEVLAAMDTPESLQVLVATATRFKQRTVRELAETCVTEIAENRGWTEDELADRSVPSGGFEDDGLLALEVGEEAKPYSARLGSDLSVKLFNPDGKEVKAIPAGKDENTKESKALLSAAKKAVKAVTTQQTTRLYDAMLGARTWTFDAWNADLAGHPIMSRLVERVIWRGLDDDGNVVVLFRPTPEGDRLTADGDDADFTKVTHVDIAHTATVAEDVRQDWLTHLDDFEVAPLFAQISRPMQVLDETQAKATAIEDRKGWLTEAFKLRGAAAKAGYDRGPVEDGAGFYMYTKTFRNAGVRAELHFTGSYVPEDNIPVAVIMMQFCKVQGQRSRNMELGQVPAMVLSEAWNDLHDIASVGAFDEEWQKKGLY